MKREVHYCDACNAEMTWIDADGDVNVQAITVPEITADVNIRTSCGSSGLMVAMFGKEFCGFECFHKSLIDFSGRLGSAVRNLEKFK